MSVLAEIQVLAIPEDIHPRVVAVIVSSPRHSFLQKVLASPEHRAAIDEASGDQFAVLQLPVANGSYRERGGGRPGTLSMLIREWIEPWQNKAVLAELGLASSEKPMFVVFMEDTNGTIRTTQLPLNDEAEDKARNRLLQVCDDVRKSIAGIAAEDAMHKDRVFRVVDDVFDNRRMHDLLSRLWKAIGEVKKLKF